jgi:hypothetical protein
MSNITINPTGTTVGSGLNTVTWSITLLSNGTQTATQSYPYSYTSSYSSNNNIQVVNNSIWSWSNISNADMYIGDIHRSNFYAITTPVLWVKTGPSGIQPGVSNRLYITDTTRSLSNVVDFYVEVDRSSPSGSIRLNNAGITFCNICGVSVITSTAFNFSNPITNAYTDGSISSINTLVPGLFGIRLGELNGDGYLDGVDFPSYEIDANASAYLGLYMLNGDLNGDAYVDASDYAVFDFNARVGSYEQRP